MTTRKLLVTEVGSMNKHLQQTAKTMSLVALLRNYHPINRRKYALQLFKEELLDKETADEFTNVKNDIWT